MRRALSTMVGLVFGVSILTVPNLASFGSNDDYGSAFAAKGGNGKGKGAGQGNGGSGKSASKGGSKSASASGSGSTKSKSDKGSKASELGALNAAHASANAMAHASFDSRVGRIAAYGQQAAIAEAAQAAADAAVLAAVDAAAALAKLDNDLANDLITQADYDLAAAELEDPAALAEKAEALQDAADAADDLAASLLEDAANKPVTEEVRAEVDRLLEGKIALPEPPVTPEPPQ